VRPRGLAGAITACAGGGLLLLLAAGRAWGSATLRAATGARVHVSVTGTAVTPALPALGLALLVLAVAVLATRGLLRRVLGAVAALAGTAAAVLAATSHRGVEQALAGRAFGVARTAVGVGVSPWQVVAVVAAVVAAAGGAATLLHGHRWTSMGRRYEAPAPAPASPDPAADDASTWAALDRGEDPTVGPDGGPSIP
jgi:uncharacterized membrane protein (TIGR02234 family)